MATENYTTTGGLQPLPTTMAQIERLPTPASGRQEYRHPKLPNLRLRVGAGGKVWNWYQRINGKQTRRTIGQFPAVGIAAAEAAAKALAGDVAKGAYRPKAVEQREGITLAEAFAGYLKHRSVGAKPLKARTVKTYGEDFALWAPFHDKPITTIEAAKVKAIHKERSSVSPARANGSLAILKAVLNYAQADLEIDVKAAAKVTARGTVKKNKVKRRSDRLAPGELFPFFAACSDHGQTGRLLQLLLLTGCRLSEIMTATVDQYNAGRGTFYIAENKSSTPIEIPLSKPAIAIIEAQIKARRDDLGDWLFPSIRPKTGNPPMTNPRKAFDMVKKAINADPRLAVHGLRRSFVSVAATFTSRYAVKALINHSEDTSDVTDGYVNLSLDELRAITEQISARITTPQVPV